MLDPFRLFGRFLVAGLKIVGYLLTSILQVAWYLAQGRVDKVGDVVGYVGRGITDAIADAVGGAITK